MLTFRLDIDAPNLAGAERQLPFAITAAINDTLALAQNAERAEIARRFTIRRKPFAERSVKIAKFAKKGAPVGELAIESPGGRSDVFGKFEWGGTMRPRDGRSLAIPVTGSTVKRSERTVVRHELRPGALLEAGQTPAGNRVFLRTRSDGRRALFEAMPKGRARLLYRLRPSAQLEARLGFVDTAARVIPRAFPIAFRASLARALATAR